MSYKINGKIEAIFEHNKYVTLGVSQSDAQQFLFLLTALELGRIKSFSVVDGSSFVCFSYRSVPQFKVVTDKRSFDDSLTEDQFTLLRCCCIDAILLKPQYEFAQHVDFECTSCDLTFYVR